MNFHDETLITDDGKVVKRHVGTIIFVGFCAVMGAAMVILGILAILNA